MCELLFEVFALSVMWLLSYICSPSKTLALSFERKAATAVTMPQPNLRCESPPNISFSLSLTHSILPVPITIGQKITSHITVKRIKEILALSVHF